jgi:peptidoglycan/LPS O-acetylase OafA/YrhL
MNAADRHLPATEPVGRYDFLDWLRVIAIFVLLWFHTGMLFVGWGWHIENAQVIEQLVLPMDIAHRLRMPLLFVIAGAGMWFALGRRSASQLLRERTLRLMVPVIVGMFLIVPPQLYFERVFRGQWDGGYVAFVLERVLELRPYPQGDFSWHHLWFIVYLYVYVLILLPLLAWWRGSRLQLRPGAWLYALALPLGLNEALLKPLFPETHNLVSDWYVFGHYLLLTLYGFVLAAMPGAWDWLAARRRYAATLGVALFVLAMALFELGWIHRDTAADAVVANVFTWVWLMAFIGYARRYLSFENRLIRWAREASYPIYILHQTIIVAVGYYVIHQAWTPWVKYGVVLTLTLISCVLLYEAGIRRYALPRFLFGMKPLPAGKRRVEPSSALV